MSYISYENVRNKNVIINVPRHVFYNCKICLEDSIIHREEIEFRLLQLKNKNRTCIIPPSKCPECSGEYYRKITWGDMKISSILSPTIFEKNTGRNTEIDKNTQIVKDFKKFITIKRYKDELRKVINH